MNGVSIRYGDVAPEAKENFSPDVTDKAEFVQLTQLQQYNLNFPNYANPCEMYQTVLDGEAVAFPSLPADANLGLWSEQLSNETGVFETPIVLTLTADGQYSSQGLTLTFDTFNQIYPTHINIKWFRYAEGIMEELSPDGGVNFYPDNAFYFCRNQVKNYNKVVITFHSLNMPKNRLKLRVIDYGYGTYFYGDELRNVKLIQEMDPISSEIAINTCDFTLDSKTDMEYSFQAKQPLNVYFNGELKATTFVKTAKRTAKRLWTIQSEDYIGLMDSIPYYGGMYENADAYEMFKDIFSVAKVPYEISESLKSVTLNGYIPYTTCREALMQVAFAVGYVVDTSNSECVKVYKLTNEQSQDPILLKRIMQGQSFTDDETTTAVEVVLHTYKPIDERIEVYNGADSGEGEELLVVFSEPLHDLEIVDGKLLKSSTNYAIINATEKSILTGAKYEHTTLTKRKTNPVVLASEIEKVVAIEDATLVSVSNISEILDKCYEWLTKNKETNLKIVEGKHVSGGDYVRFGQVKYDTEKYGTKTESIVKYDTPVNVGEIITAETEYLGNITGRIVKETFNLNGGVIIKEAVLK